MTEPTVLLGPGERGLDGVSQKVPGCRAFHHGGGHAVDPLCRASGGLHRRSLHARQARVDAFDRRIGPVGIDFNDEFEPVIGHESLRDLLR